MIEKNKRFKYDGRSRPSGDLYRENFNRIFGKGIINTKTTVKDLKKILKDTKDESKS